MKWIGQNVWDQVSKFRNTVDFSEDVTFYKPSNDGNPTIRLGSAAGESLGITASYNSGGQTLDKITFDTTTTSATAHDGRMVFNVDGTDILTIRDAGINLKANMGIQIAGTNILTDSSGTATLSNIDDLDATTIATFNAHLTAGDITSVTAGTGLSGGGSSGDVTLNVDAAQSGITSLGTLTGLTIDADKTIANSDGAMLHIDSSTITDGYTSEGATTAMYTHVAIERPALTADASDVTTTDAATLYISGPPVASTNQTLTRAHAIWVDAGNIRLDGELYMGTTRAMDSNGKLRVSDQSTITGLGTISSGTWQGTPITAAYIADNKGTKHFGDTIKILPTDFMSNEDGGANKSAQFRDDTIIGVRSTHNDAELYAFVAIPEGKTATSVTVYGNDTGLAVNVYESDINAGALTDKTPGGGCTVGSACDITDVVSDATNYLAIKVTTTNYTNDIVYGGIVTIS